MRPFFLFLVWTLLLSNAQAQEHPHYKKIQGRWVLDEVKTRNLQLKHLNKLRKQNPNKTQKLEEWAQITEHLKTPGHQYAVEHIELQNNGKAMIKYRYETPEQRDWKLSPDGKTLVLFFKEEKNKIKMNILRLGGDRLLLGLDDEENFPVSFYAAQPYQLPAKAPEHLVAEWQFVPKENQVLALAEAQKLETKIQHLDEGEDQEFFEEQKAILQRILDNLSGMKLRLEPQGKAWIYNPLEAPEGMNIRWELDKKTPALILIEGQKRTAFPIIKIKATQLHLMVDFVPVMFELKQ